MGRLHERLPNQRQGRPPNRAQLPRGPTAKKAERLQGRESRGPGGARKAATRRGGEEGGGGQEEGQQQEKGDQRSQGGEARGAGAPEDPGAGGHQLEGDHPAAGREQEGPADQGLPIHRVPDDRGPGAGAEVPRRRHRQGDRAAGQVRGGERGHRRDQNKPDPPEAQGLRGELLRGVRERGGAKGRRRAERAVPRGRGADDPGDQHRRHARRGVQLDQDADRPLLREGRRGAHDPPAGRFSGLRRGGRGQARGALRAVRGFLPLLVEEGELAAAREGGSGRLCEGEDFQVLRGEGVEAFYHPCGGVFEGPRREGAAPESDVCGGEGYWAQYAAQEVEREIQDPDFEP